MMKKTQWMVAIYDGHTHIERRVWEDKTGKRFVRVNGCSVELSWYASKMHVEFFNP